MNTKTTSSGDRGAAGTAPNLAFLHRAEDFVAAHRSHLAFRLFGWLLGAKGAELDQVLKSVYCACINNYDIPESAWKSRVGFLVLPAYLWTSKNWLWRRETKALFMVETTDRDHFERFLAAMYERLPEAKRLTPRAPETFAGAGLDLTRPWTDSVRLGDLLALTILAPVLQLLLWRLSKKTGLNLLKACRQAISIYISFNGYFRRYPCRHFVTFEDVVTQPSRYLAFRRNCDGDLVVIQNGSRIPHPMFAYGMMDRYFLFGEAYAEAMRAVRVKARDFKSVGAMCLDERFGLYQAETAGGPPENRYDVLYIDQGVHPHNGIDKRVSDSMLLILDNLAAYRRAHPAVRVAYQLRDYGPQTRAREAVTTLLRERYPDFIVLDNDSSKGDSYRNILRSNLVMTFESTLGLEALRMGKKVCFVNYSGDPTETICEDPAFQLEDAAADYGRFERKVSELLAMPLSGVPSVAHRYHEHFDGRLQQRIAALLIDADDRRAENERRNVL